MQESGKAVTENDMCQQLEAKLEPPTPSPHEPIPFELVGTIVRDLGLSGYNWNGKLVLNPAPLHTEAAVRLGEALPTWEFVNKKGVRLRLRVGVGWEEFYDTCWEPWGKGCEPSLDAEWFLRPPGEAEQRETTTPKPATSSAYDHQEGGSHYNNFPIQPAYYNIFNGIPWAEGEVIKYVSRWRTKGGVQDLKKARHICDMLIEFHEGQLDYDKLVDSIRAIEVST